VNPLRTWVWLAAWLWLLPTAAQAHLLNMTRVDVGIDGAGEVVVNLQVDMSRAAGGGLAYYRLSRIADPLADAEARALLDRLAAAITLRVGTQTLALAVATAKFPSVGREVFLDPLSWPMTEVQLRGRLPAVQHDADTMVGVFEPGFRFEEPIALTIVDTREARSMTRWLVTSQTSPPFPLQATGAAPLADDGGSSLREFLTFGFLHILPGGLDHMLFVLGLILGARSMKSLLVLVTCFTLAHSITLGMASVGLIRWPASVVEPLITASIVWIGVENLIGSASRQRYRPLLVFGFGLLHGLGFASALSDLHAPPGRFLLSLLSFNAGIELGQLAVIAITTALLYRWRNRPWFRQRIVRPASLLIAVLAAAWTVQRLLA
jgi:hydrogenase/urease accessory protein HupE